MQAGPQLGPGRGAGRASGRGSRPHSRPSPGARPGHGPNRPASWPAQAGVKAGRPTEATGLLAGSGRFLGRLVGHERGGDRRRRSTAIEDEGGGSRRGQRSCGPHPEPGGVVDEVRGGPAATESAGGDTAVAGGRGCGRRLREPPARFLGLGGRGGCGGGGGGVGSC